MSKIGRKPISLAGVTVQVSGQKIQFKGPKASGEHVLPPSLEAQKKDDFLCITAKKGDRSLSKKQDINRVWGLHRALLANEIAGSKQEFQVPMKIVGLGYKATVSGKKIKFSLGYSHDITFELPANVSAEVDKTGQLLTVKSSDKEAAGLVYSKIRRLCPPEPYKGTGIRKLNEEILRKAGKAKASSG
jgi:large subunit ribosomal protein L6